MEEKKVEETVEQTQPIDEPVQQTQAGSVQSAQTQAEQQADPADVEKNKTMAILAYFIFFLPLITDAKDSPFAKFHANQSLVLTIGFVAMMFISGAIITLLLTIPISIALFVFWIMGIINASNGKMTKLPIIGGITIIK
jgi:uncharacterized membrane protein